MAMIGKVLRMHPRETKSGREIVKATSLARERARKYLRIDRAEAQSTGGLSGVMFAPLSAVCRCHAPYDGACSCAEVTDPGHHLDALGGHSVLRRHCFGRRERSRSSKQAARKLTFITVRSWPSQVEDSLRLVAGNLSFTSSPRPGLGPRGDRPVVAESSQWRPQIRRLKPVVQLLAEATNGRAGRPTGSGR